MYLCLVKYPWFYSVDRKPLDNYSGEYLSENLRKKPLLQNIIGEIFLDSSFGYLQYAKSFIQKYLFVEFERDLFNSSDNSNLSLHLRKEIFGKHLKTKNNQRNTKKIYQLVR